MPAWAQDSACVEPIAPPPVSGANVSSDRLRAALDDARSFITQSNLYQDCLSRELEAARIRASSEGHALDPAVEAAVKGQIAASQKAQERVSQTVNTALSTYKQAHAN